MKSRIGFAHALLLAIAIAGFSQAALPCDIEEAIEEARAEAEDEAEQARTEAEDEAESKHEDACLMATGFSFNNLYFECVNNY